MMVTPPTGPSLSQLVKYACQRYAQRRNRQRHGSGKLFEQRYFSKVIRSDEQVGYATAYIDVNAELAGLKCGYYRHYPFGQSGMPFRKLS